MAKLNDIAFGAGVLVVGMYLCGAGISRAAYESPGTLNNKVSIACFGLLNLYYCFRDRSVEESEEPLQI